MYKAKTTKPMNTQTRPGSLKKLVMWYKVKQLFSIGLNQSQISRKLGIYRGTVRRYLSMSEAEFVQSNIYHREYNHKLDAYEDSIVSWLKDTPYLSSSQIEDRLKEHYPDYDAVCSKTVYNYVTHLRAKHTLPKYPEDHPRCYEQVPESPYGESAQVDFGERYMKTSTGAPVKVYFFAMVLCRSRYKFVYFSRIPFNTALTVYAHELAFQYFGGKPQQIIYDQDKVLLRDENLGDLILTRGFSRFKGEQHFECVFCRKSDPESKGKVENVVKYVKGNFLRGRQFSTIENLNGQGLAWLARTGNGSLHHGIHRIPADVFEEERPFLTPYTGVPTAPKEELHPHKVRKDNTVSYRCNYYTVPTGTYTGRESTVFLEEKDSRLLIYSHDTGKLIAEHEIHPGKGRLVRNSSHKRDREAGLEELEEKIKGYICSSGQVTTYLLETRKRKPRYYRDSLCCIIQEMCKYTPDVLKKALETSMEMGSYNAHQLVEVAETIRKKEGIDLLPEKGDVLPATKGTCPDMIPEQSNIDTYNKLFT